jgi:hypothetical protein
LAIYTRIREPLSAEELYRQHPDDFANLAVAEILSFNLLNGDTEKKDEC